MGSAHVEYVAHHWLLLAGPAFLPAVIVVGVVLYIAIRDRRRRDDDADRSDAEERRKIPDDDAAKRRLTLVDDDAGQTEGKRN